jgi:hypothetical protein
MRRGDQGAIRGPRSGASPLLARMGRLDPLGAHHWPAQAGRLSLWSVTLRRYTEIQVPRYFRGACRRRGQQTGTDSTPKRKARLIQSNPALLMTPSARMYSLPFKERQNPAERSCHVRQDYEKERLGRPPKPAAAQISRLRSGAVLCVDGTLGWVTLGLFAPTRRRRRGPSCSGLAIPGEDSRSDRLTRD